MEYNSKPETAVEALAQWDAGDIVWTIEMGGLGPGYEQCIHIAAFELIRESLPLQKPDEGAVDDDWRAFGKQLDELPHKWLEGMGLSGAQYGAALNVAMVTIRHGWRAGLDRAPQERLIQVSRAWPQVPPAPSTEAASEPAH